MRWINFTAAGRTAYGILEGDRIREVRGGPFGEYEATGRVHDLAQVKIEIPFLPRTFYAAGLNYVEHVKEGAAKRGEAPQIPTKPDMGYRAVNALIAHDEPVVIPADATEKVHYEGEIAVVIGRKAKHLSKEDAMSCVLGYTIGNDVSERSWQRGDRTFWRAKNSDTFAPMGPWIETDIDLDKLVTRVRLNGKQMIEFPTNDMLFSIPRYIAAMTKYLTLYPGDMIWMGTEGATENMKHGDTIEIEISGIGTLSNPVIRES